jgi:peptide/nickel transport system permease protein
MTETATQPVLAEAAMARSRAYWPTVWRQFRRSILNRVARWWVLLLIILAVVVPFLANGAPYTATFDGRREYPLFRNLTRVDLILLLAGAVLLTFYLLRNHWASWNFPFSRVGSAIFIGASAVIFISSSALVIFIATIRVLWVAVPAGAASSAIDAIVLLIELAGAGTILVFICEAMRPATFLFNVGRSMFVGVSGVLVLSTLSYGVFAFYCTGAFPRIAFLLFLESLAMALLAVWIWRNASGIASFLVAAFFFLALFLTATGLGGFGAIAQLFLIGLLLGIYGLLHRLLSELDDRPYAWFVFLVYLLVVAALAIQFWKTDYLDSRDYPAMTRAGELHDAIRAPLPWGFKDQEPLKLDRIFEYPSRDHVLGTDGNGRDALARLLWSSRAVLAIGLISEVIALIIGVVYGSLMGYFVGTVDILGMRFVEIVESVPTLFLLITFVALYGRNLFMLMVIIGLTSWTGIARFVRAEFLRIRQLDYVAAAKAAGLPLWSILFRHMLPNGLTPVIVTFTFGVAGAVGSESILSFLGIGVEPPTPSWGSMLNEAGNPAETFRWWLAIAPGLLIFLTVFAYNIIGEGLRDAIDPRLNKME